LNYKILVQIKTGDSFTHLYPTFLSDLVDIVNMSGKDISADILAAVAARNEQNKKRRLIDLQELMKTTQFTKQEIMMMYRGFKQVRLY
jgi:hypothetical protein